MSGDSTCENPGPLGSGALVGGRQTRATCAYHVGHNGPCSWETSVAREDACSNCRRPIFLIKNVGWVHGELPQYAHEPITCSIADPVSDRNNR